MIRSPRPGDVSDDGLLHYDSHAWGWRALSLPRAAVADAATASFGLDLTAEPVLLGDGLLNESWRLESPAGRHVLRVSRRERSPAQVRVEHAVARAWAGAVPQVVVAASDATPVVEGHVLTLFPFVDGTSGAAADPVARADELAALVATLHRRTLACGLTRQRPGFTSVDEQPRWFGWPGARRAVVDRFGHEATLDAAVETVDAAIAALDLLLDAWTAAGRLARRGMVHGDLNPRNLLYRDGRLVALIDTDDCRVEPFVWDVAGLAYSDPAVDPSRVWETYRECGGVLPDEDRELLLPFARIGSLTAIMWLQDGGTPGEGPATHLARDNLLALAAELRGEAPARDA